MAKPESVKRDQQLVTNNALSTCEIVDGGFEVDGKGYRFIDQVIWPSLATGPGLPATVAPIERTKHGLPIGIQIIGPFLEDRTTIAFAELMEREFGGFMPPPAFAE